MLEDVGVLRHVERLREARVRDRAVVALEEVLRADLPVARVLVALGPRVEAEPVDLDPAVREQPGELTQGARERPGVAIGVDEHERAPRLGRDGDERQRLGVEGVLALGPRRVPQRPVEVVRPRVVRALDRLALRVRLAEHVASVPADVHERAELAVAAADDEDRQRSRPRPASCSPARRRGRLASRTATSARRCAPARRGAPPGRRTRHTGSVRMPVSACPGGRVDRVHGPGG